VEANLKQQMLGRGMSAAEIEQVLKASATPGVLTLTSQFTGNAVTDKAHLIKLLVDNGYKGEDIALVLRAFETPGRGSPGPEATQQKAEVAGKLVQQGLEAEEIDKVLQAFRGDALPASERVVSKG
jgi:SOS response regulatory protein OraA/RecX